MSPLWVRKTKNTDSSTAHSFACSALLASLALSAALRSNARSLAHFAHFLARGNVNESLFLIPYFFSVPRTLKVEELKEEFRNRLVTLEKRLERESKGENMPIIHIFTKLIDNRTLHVKLKGDLGGLKWKREDLGQKMGRW